MKTIFNKQIVSFGLATLAALPTSAITNVALAQSTPSAGVTIPLAVPGKIEEIAPTPSETPIPTPTSPTAPSAPLLQPPITPQPSDRSPSSVRFRVRHPQQSWWLDECDRPKGGRSLLKVSVD